ncbi:SDR family NAD(P)-dependent oxidoreductase, partial [Acinetobacter baumannii]
NLGVAAAFAAAGASVGVASRNPDKVAAAVAQLSIAGREASGYVADVREPQAVANALSAFASKHGGIDVLVSGAAGNFPAAAAALSPN